jgi:hypothetical protein
MKKQKRKAARRRTELGCIVCGGAQGTEYLKVGKNSSKELIDGFLGEKFKDQFVSTMYGYTVLA